MSTALQAVTIRRRIALALPMAAAAAALIGAPSAATAATPATVAIASPQTMQGAATQGIIMRDGGICDPIRHMGC